MGDEDEGDSEIALQRLQFYLHLFAELEIERAKRFVEQQDLGLVDKGAGQRHALPLATGQLRGPASAETAKRHEGEGFFGLAVPRRPCPRP